MSKTLKLSNQTKINYWVSHEEKKPTIVMIHGFTGSHEGFQYIIPRLPGFRIIAPDLPGFGESDIKHEDWSIESIARLANEFVAELGLSEPPYLLGHSMGGLVASAMLADAPYLYAKEVILISPVPTAIRKNDKRLAGAILGALQYRIGHKLPLLGKKFVKSKNITKAITTTIMTTKDPALKREIHGHHLRNLDFISSIEFYDKLYRDINRRGAADYAYELRKRDLLLILGEKDAVTPLVEERKLIELTKPKKIVIIPKVGHLSHYEKPVEIASAIQEFLSPNSSDV